MKSRVFALVPALTIGWIALAVPAKAFELNGSWATAPTACGQVFIKKDGAISFRQDSDQYGGGFVIEGNKIRDQMQTCNISRRKEDGNVIHLVAMCATDIMASNVQTQRKNRRRQHHCANFPGNAGVHPKLFALPDVIYSANPLVLRTLVCLSLVPPSVSGDHHAILST